jgi:sterol desaturase/sphingolipid hydroxylase (fatty acid hydroxylase superfamily)
METMTETILGNEKAIRLVFFFGVLALMMAWEMMAPRRPLASPRAVRWTANLGIVFLNTALLRIVFPMAAVGMAELARVRGWGLFNAYEFPYWLAVVLSVMVLDLVIYLQHVMVHAVPVFWRLHRMHHADTDYDTTTALRFHPVEILLSMGIKLGAVTLLGPPVLGVLAFEVLLNGTAMFNHGNVRLPLAVDRWLRLVMVTPDMHRVHHSVIEAETNSNFGFNLPWWDRLCGTYRAQPAEGHLDMTIGLGIFRDPGQLHLHRMLIQPLINAEKKPPEEDPPAVSKAE